MKWRGQTRRAFMSMNTRSNRSILPRKNVEFPLAGTPPAIRTTTNLLTVTGSLSNRLRAELTRRGVHADVLKYCAADFLRQDYFDAVFETSKSLAEKIRQRTGINADGAQLFDLALPTPPIRQLRCKGISLTLTFALFGGQVIGSERAEWSDLYLAVLGSSAHLRTGCGDA